MAMTAACAGPPGSGDAPANAQAECLSNATRNTPLGAPMIWTRVGTAFYVLWGLLHLYAGYGTWQLAQTASSESLGARVEQMGVFLSVIAVAVLVIWWIRRRRDRERMEELRQEERREAIRELLGEGDAGGPDTGRGPGPSTGPRPPGPSEIAAMRDAAGGFIGLPSGLLS